MNKKTLPPPPDFDSPEEAKDIIHFLWNKLAELEDRLNQNSRNSSVPPSQQPLHNKAKNTSPNRKKSGKKQGAQPGHVEWGIFVFHAPQHTSGQKSFRAEVWIVYFPKQPPF
ncbi:DUF6444 domain-containing protein [Vibrio cincinnatiensis]|uniref:DUF6444 domain-containing protein n=1 Tax=Vibrio TaxID=662 RepID=UPI003B97096E